MLTTKSRKLPYQDLLYRFHEEKKPQVENTAQQNLLYIEKKKKLFAGT